VRHLTSPRFWACYGELPSLVQEHADRAFRLLKADPKHPSLHLKKVGQFWSVRIGLHYRALAVEVPDGCLWFWIGRHSDYDKLLG